jgi:hypothetical protein
MAFAYTGTTFMPPLLGFMASLSTIAIFPIFILIFVVVMLLCSKKLNKKVTGMGNGSDTAAM